MSASTDRRAPPEIGRSARLELVFACRNGRTVLAHSYAEPPLRVGRCLETLRGVHMILASSAPGVFGGDDFEQRVTVGSGAVVRLTSQSALQAHPAPGEQPARLRSRFEVADGGELSCEWDPIIPFAGARVDQRIELHVAAGGRLSWSDALMSGRHGCGESWHFASFDHELRVLRERRLTFLERYRIAPRAGTAMSRWTVGQAGYIGTVLEMFPGGTETQDGLAPPGRDDFTLVERIHSSLGELDGVSGSADRLDGALLLVRIAAATGVSFRRARASVAQCLTAAEC